LYIWSCRKKTCRRKEGSVRGIRGVRIEKGAASKAKASKPEKEKEAKQEEKPQPQLGESLFGVKKGGTGSGAPTNPFANPFSSSSSGPAAANPFSKATSTSTPTPTPSIELSRAGEDDASKSLHQTFAEKVRLYSPLSTAQPARPHEPWPAESSFPQAYSRYYLDAEYETLDVPSTPQIPSNVSMEVDTESSEKGGKEDKEVYESSLDETFQKFADRVGQNAEQVLRYEYKGKPLLYSDNDSVGKSLAGHAENASSSNARVSVSSGGAGMPRCLNCGADRVFETQLTTHAITELEADEMGIDGMEWGTIILGVCSKDCKPNDVAEGEVGYVEEWAGVQWEELASKR
jgi:pre-rRNA-processing protein TSR4